jgi:gluconolactonase
LPPSVYYIDPGGKVMRVVENLPGANGIILSPDEKTLYVNNRSEYIVAFDVQQDGTVTNRRNYAKYDGSMGGDGLTIDSEGRLYTASGGRVQIFDPKGQYLGSIPLPTTNLAFAGPDKKTLYMVGGSAGGLGLVDGAAYKVQMLAQGFKGRAK